MKKSHNRVRLLHPKKVLYLSVFHFEISEVLIKKTLQIDVPEKVREKVLF